MAPSMRLWQKCRVEYRLLGPTGVRVSSLCLGTMSFGGESDEAASGAMFHRARELGINVFDAADVYQGGASERILGRLIASCRDEVVVKTKAYFPTGRDINARGSSRLHLVRAVEGSLERLNTDRIDLFYLHRFDELASMEETMRALDDLVRQGKVLYLGASNFAAWQFQKALGLAEARRLSPFVAIQPMYNLVKRQAEVEILPMALAENVAVFPYSPLGGGLLSGKYRRDARPTEGRLQRVKMYTDRYGADAYFEIAERFTALAAELGHHPASLAVAWVISHPAVTSAILGARDLAQLEPSLLGAKVEMNAELRARISALSPEPAPATDRNEERTGNDFGKRLLSERK